MGTYHKMEPAICFGTHSVKREASRHLLADKWQDNILDKIDSIKNY